jgi:hypothetical protein
MMGILMAIFNHYNPKMYMQCKGLKTGLITHFRIAFNISGLLDGRDKIKSNR